MDLQATFQEAFRVLHKTGIGIIDIGARDGLNPMFKEVAALIDAVGFEPDIEECKRLNKDTSKSAMYRSLVLFPFGLGNRDGQRTLHLCRSRGASSLYKPDRFFLDRFPGAERFDIESQLTIPVRSLDGIVGDPAIHLPKCIDFIKIDTQGSELDILQGGRKILCSQIVAVEVEVEFAGLYKSQPLFRDVDALLSECGFTLFKLRRVEWVRKGFEHQPQLSAGQLVFGDALYLRDPLNSRHQPWMPQSAHQAEALILLSTLYDLHDFALEMISVPRISEMLDGENVKRYILNRCRKLNRPWSRVRIFLDLLRLLKAVVSRTNRFGRYEQHWGRGDRNFYTRV